MATSAFRLYNEAKKYLLTADLDLNSTAMRIGLFNGGVSSYTLSTWASLITAGNPVSGGGYAAKSLTGLAVTAGASAKVIKFDASDKVWTASGGNFVSVGYLAVGISGGKALGWVQLTTTPFTLSDGNTLTIQWNASGLFTLSGGVT